MREFELIFTPYFMSASLLLLDIMYHNVSLGKEINLVLTFDYVISLFRQTLHRLSQLLTTALLLFVNFLFLYSIAMLLRSQILLFFTDTLPESEGGKIDFKGARVKAEMQVIGKVALLRHFFFRNLLFFRHLHLSIKTMVIHYVVFFCYLFHLERTVLAFLPDLFCISRSDLF